MPKAPSACTAESRLSVLRSFSQRIDCNTLHDYVGFHLQSSTCGEAHQVLSKMAPHITLEDLTYVNLNLSSTDCRLFDLFLYLS